MKKILPMLCFLALAACSSSGVYVDEASAKSFTKGKSSISDVMQKLGKPTNKAIDSNGNTEIRYDYVEMQTRPETFIPYIGYAVGGADTRVNSATFAFNSKGILTDYKFSANETGTGMNFASGTKFERVETKPRVNK